MEGQQLAALSGRFLLGLVFLHAALPKLLAGADFRHALSRYELLPARTVAPVAHWLPRLELAAALALLGGIAVSGAAMLAAILLLVFGGAVAINLLRGRAIDCGCYSSTAPTQIGWNVLVRNLALALLAAFVALRTTPTLAADALWLRTPGPTPGDAVGVLVATSSSYFAWVLLVAGRRLWRLTTAAIRPGAAAQ